MTQHLQQPAQRSDRAATLAVTVALARRRVLLQRRQGQLIPDLDLLIAATALHHDLTLLTRNIRHFNRIPELRLYQPS